MRRPRTHAGSSPSASGHRSTERATVRPASSPSGRPAAARRGPQLVPCARRRTDLGPIDQRIRFSCATRTNRAIGCYDQCAKAIELGPAIGWRDARRAARRGLDCSLGEHYRAVTMRTRAFNCSHCERRSRMPTVPARITLCISCINGDRVEGRIRARVNAPCACVCAR